MSKVCSRVSGAFLPDSRQSSEHNTRRRGRQRFPPRSIRFLQGFIRFVRCSSVTHSERFRNVWFCQMVFVLDGRVFCNDFSIFVRMSVNSLFISVLYTVLLIKV